MKLDNCVTRRKFLKYSGAISTGLMFPEFFYKDSNRETDVVTFGLISDSHYADRISKGTRFYRDSIPKMKHCISFFNKMNLDFIIHLGDLKDEDEEPDEINTIKYLKTIEKEFSKFDGNRYHVLGNHDIDSISKKQFLKHVTNCDIETQSSYYSYTLNGIRFIVLDANFKSDNTPYSKGDFDWKDTNIDSLQMSWLQEILNKSNLPCVIFVHQMLDESGGKSYSINNASQIRRILEISNKVLIVFQGHIHKEIYSHINNIHYYTFNAMVDHQGHENNSFSIIKIKKNLDIIIDGYYRSSNQIFKYLKK